MYILKHKISNQMVKKDENKINLCTKLLECKI